MIVDNGVSNTKVVQVSDSSWEKEVIEASKTMPVFVDCWADWCTPCKMFQPIVEKVANEMSDKIKFASLDVDNNPATSQKYMIMAIPTLMVFMNGEKVFQQSGLLPENSLKEMLNDHLSRMNK